MFLAKINIRNELFMIYHKINDIMEIKIIRFGKLDFSIILMTFIMTKKPTSDFRNLKWQKWEIFFHKITKSLPHNSKYQGSYGDFKQNFFVLKIGDCSLFEIRYVQASDHYAIKNRIFQKNKDISLSSRS